MARTNYQARLSALNSLTPTVRELEIDFIEPNSLPFEAGQFVMLHVPQEGETKPVKRAYSIASTDKTHSSLKLVIKLVEGGVASEYVKSLEAGATLELSGPFGKHFFKTPPTKNVIFLCTGAGVSQHYSYLVSKCEAFPEVNYMMLFGVWNEEEIFYKEKLEEAAQKIPNFQFEYVLDHAKEAWSGKTGFITHYLDELDCDFNESTFYLCGNPAMIKEVKGILAEKDIGKEFIFAEAFH